MNRNIFKIIIIILVLVSCVIIGASVYSQRSSSFMFTKTTNLSEEHIAGLQLYDNIGIESSVDEINKIYGNNYYKRMSDISKNKLFTV